MRCFGRVYPILPVVKPRRAVLDVVVFYLVGFEVIIQGLFYVLFVLLRLYGIDEMSKGRFLAIFVWIPLPKFLKQINIAKSLPGQVFPAFRRNPC